MYNNINKNEKIDIVLLWVDGNDKEWQEEKSTYQNINGDAGKNRFRDCNNLQYVFRSIEKNAPWVNKIFFITYGHLPKWLDTSNPKLVVVNHKDYIPKKYLPTYNSNVIELNLHRIKDLSEQFILFNDDLFLLKNTKETDFFKNGKPTDTYVEYTQLPTSYNDNHFFMKANILAILNKHFDKNQVKSKHFSKMINFKYGNLNFKTLYLLNNKKFSGFWNFHSPQPYLKSTFNKIWEKEKNTLDIACKNKFRNSTDLGHYLCRYWQMLEGNFQPKKDESKYFIYKNDNKEVISAIDNEKYKYICINDALVNINFTKAIREVNKIFLKKFPKKSSFEK